MLLFIFSLFVISNALEYCKDSNYVDGEWVKSPNLEKSFSYCCDVDLPNCTQTFQLFEQTDGKWPAVLGNGCSGFHYLQSNGLSLTTLTELEKYQFVPKNCQLIEWDAIKFCELLGSRTIFMSGDSTMQQTASTLKSLLLEKNATCENQIHFGISDFLTYHPTESRGEYGGFTKYLQHYRAEIVFLGIGAHYYNSAKYHSVIQNFDDLHDVADYLFPKLSLDIQFLRRYRDDHYSPQHIIFKTENPGHMNCGLSSAFNPDAINPGPDKHWSWSNEDISKLENSYSKFNWFRGRILDHLMQEFVRMDGILPSISSSSPSSSTSTSTSTSSSLNNNNNHNVKRNHSFDRDGEPIPTDRPNTKLSILDMSPLYQRPDAHPMVNGQFDCLHYVVPGPLDLFARILMHKLFMKEL